MKTKLCLLIILFTFSFYAFPQLRVKTNGQIQLGLSPQYATLADTISPLWIGKFNGQSPAIAFGEYNLVRIEAKCENNTDGEPDALNFIGKGGFYFSTAPNQSPILQYDANSPGEGFIFEEYITAWDYYKLSDSRFKENIVKLGHNSLTGLKHLSAVSFQLKKEKESREVSSTKSASIRNNSRTHFGFLAQEVKKVYPELVRTDSAGYMYVDYMSMIPLIVNALNEIQARVDSQEIVITQLQQELVALKNGDAETASPLHKSQRNTASAEPESAIVPTLYQNNPNPFSATTSIRFALTYETVQADLYIYDMQGTQIRRIEIAERGESQVTLQGSELSAGMYIYSLIADGKEIDSKRMILTK